MIEFKNVKVSEFLSTLVSADFYINNHHFIDLSFQTVADLRTARKSKTEIQVFYLWAGMTEVMKRRIKETERKKTFYMRIKRN